MVSNPPSARPEWGRQVVGGGFLCGMSAVSWAGAGEGGPGFPVRAVSVAAGPLSPGWSVCLSISLFLSETRERESLS